MYKENGLCAIKGCEREADLKYECEHCGEYVCYVHAHRWRVAKGYTAVEVINTKS